MADGENATMEAEVVADLARKAATPHVLDPAKLHAVVGEGVETLDLEQFLDSPRRRTGVYTPADLDSFIEYVARHKDEEHTTLWVNVAAAQVVAIINDNAPAESGWRDHRAQLALSRTPEWRHWLGADGNYMGQEEFAEHLQHGIVEIVDPDSATMLEIAQSIEGKTKADWKSATRLDNGAVGFAYQEEIEASAGRSGSLEIPSRFQLSVAPFVGGEAETIEARLRYRVRSGALVIGYKLERPEVVERSILEGLKSHLAGIGFKHVYMGAAPS